MWTGHWNWAARAGNGSGPIGRQGVVMSDHGHEHHEDHAGHAHGAGGHHGHGHSHGPASYDGAFAIGTALNLGFVAAEVVFGVAANSVALLADAAHNFG